VETDFRPAKKAHPAFVAADLDELRRELQAGGFKIVEDSNVPEVRRFFTEDPWGNRLEIVEQQRGE
jgi:predicted enzyme related to lactoylglutathione lyase